MQSIVLSKEKALPLFLERLLPRRLVEEIYATLAPELSLEEVRLRRDRRASLVVGGENVPLFTVLSGAEMDALLPAFCDGSLYTHGETVCHGYLTLKGGIRVGVCGRANTVSGRVTGV